ncbi:hypothetical protein GGE65_003211 [Skermanella aerolata]|jgi:hypothetical protein|uniref:Uncharacterized protein n=1 Tax=Skermanella aerolata TaxID=393310 RepID=A0A512DSS2_9PROT|nr:hypothetical protein [Skermanella aerolata]KJB96033.1 hypothetical protein N826_37780 [Skermanella aerolata KACC 11604]GEO39529.1 hypothetical protein SAE02_36770 [Skermanella aerolata]
MHDPWDSGDDSGTVFRDVILLALAGFVFITVLLLPHINPKAKQGEGSTDPPGNVIAEMRWDDKLRTDVDLWVQAPGDVPVGYSNKSGLIFNLLRDDLGSHADPTDVNFETSFSRGIPPGEYTVNVHLFRNLENTYPINVRVVVRVKTDNEAGARPIAATTVRLDREGQELTAFRFSLTEKGELVPNSMNSVFKPLRSAKTY